MFVQDKEFGEVIVRKNSLVKGVKFSVSTSGRLQMSVPKYTSEFLAKRFLNSNREMIRERLPVKDPNEQRSRDYQKRLLAKKAKEYLPYRLEYFAKLYGYKYDRCRFSHANTRWGSCTHRKHFGSNKDEITISLNIGLMKVPEILRDYVIIHELAHINHPDHSKAFWAEVQSHDKNYKIHEKKLKLLNPGI